MTPFWEPRGWVLCGFGGCLEVGTGAIHKGVGRRLHNVDSILIIEVFHLGECSWEWIDIAVVVVPQPIGKSGRTSLL